MTILTKLSNLLTSAIELPNALHAYVEMAREAESSRSVVDEHDGAQICDKLTVRIAELERELKRWHSWAQLRFNVTSENCDDLRRLIEYEEEKMLSRERDASEEKQKNWGFQIERLTNEANELARAIEAERRQLSMANKEVEILRCELNREREASSVERFIGDERWAWARERIKRLQNDLSGCEMDRAMEKNRRIKYGLRLARIRDAELIRRYHRTVEMGGECYGTEPPSGVDVLFRDCSGDKPGPWQFGAVPTYGKFEWRYLSPEDMPND